MEYSHLKISLVLCICVVLCGVGGTKEQEQVTEQEVVVLPVELLEAGENTQAQDEGSVESGRKVRQYFGAPPFFGPRPYYGGFGGGYGGGFGGGYGGGFGGGFQRTRVVTRTRTRVRGGFGGFGGGYYG